MVLNAHTKLMSQFTSVSFALGLRLQSKFPAVSKVYAQNYPWLLFLMKLYLLSCQLFFLSQLPSRQMWNMIEKDELRRGALSLYN
jgi:hypothetical protein